MDSGPQRRRSWRGLAAAAFVTLSLLMLGCSGSDAEEPRFPNLIPPCEAWGWSAWSESDNYDPGDEEGVRICRLAGQEHGPGVWIWVYKEADKDGARAVLRKQSVDGGTRLGDASARPGAIPPFIGGRVENLSGKLYFDPINGAFYSVFIKYSVGRYAVSIEARVYGDGDGQAWNLARAASWGLLTEWENACAAFEQVEPC